ncbi:MAG: diphthine synthase [Candidatus Thermoplasmatota archaeon]|nr:diphthine synthase [Candidatus Thermoplasmatota archaeon]
MKRLSMIGLGIADERSIPLRGLDHLRQSDVVFAELYTSILKEGSLERLGEMVGKEIHLLDREGVEEEELVIKALQENEKVCFLTAGDPLTATTHQELRFDAVDRGAEVEIINSASIFNTAAGLAGLQHYKFGRTTTIAYPEGNYFPTSPLDMIIENMERGMHTLVLLDIKADRKRYMSASEACELILKMGGISGKETVGPGTMVVAVMRAGRPDWKVVYAEIGELSKMDMGAPPHCLMVPGKLHFTEEEALDRFRI